MSSPAMINRRNKWSGRKYSLCMLAHHRRLKSNRQYGVTYGVPQLLHKGSKP